MKSPIAAAVEKSITRMLRTRHAQRFACLRTATAHVRSLLALGALCVLSGPSSAAEADDDILETILPAIIAATKGNSSPPPPPPPQPTCANTISSAIAVNTVWQDTSSLCDYRVVSARGEPNSGIALVVSANLTIEPGVSIQFAPDASLVVRDGGNIQAVGERSARITLQSDNPALGLGQGIYFSVDSGASRISYADFIALGKEDGVTGHDAAIAGVHSSAGLALTNTTVSGSSSSGVMFDDLNIVQFENNVFSDNAQFGVEVNAAQAHKLDAASNYLGTTGRRNGRPFIRVDGVGSFDQFEQDATWKALNAPYFVVISLDIESGELNVAPGARFIFDAGSGIDVEQRGSLRAIGTASQPIVFTGEQAQRGYWDGIYYSRSTSVRNRLEHVEVSYAGQGFFDANVAAFNSYLDVVNSTITDSDTWGVCSDRGSSGTISSTNQYRNNRLGNVTFDC